METAPSPPAPLGALLVRLRKRADLTQEALAERAGISVNTISNLEAGRGHLLAPCAELAVSLLRQCPHLQLLVTSRERLGVSGERAYRVPSLAAPAAGEPITPTTVAALRETEGVRLFVERARAGQAEFAVTQGNAAVVARICRALDGLPLAIELAAARVGSLPLEELARRLDESLALLAEGPRDLPPRQRGLRATLDWSWALLGEAERVLLRRLAVFRGGWTVEAAAGVCGSAELRD